MGRLANREDAVMSLPRLGKVKIGDTHPEKGYPMSRDTFRFTSKHSIYIEELHEALMEEYGTTEPNVLKILFHSNDTDEVCDQRLELRDKSGKLKAVGDGLIFTVYTETGEEKRDFTPKNNDPESIQASEAAASKFMKTVTRKMSTEKHTASWDEVLTLRFIISSKSFRRLGVWEFRTKGKETSIKSIINSFDSVAKMIPSIQNIPFELKVSKHKSNTSGRTKEYPVVDLVCNVSQKALFSLQENAQAFVDFQGELSDDRILSIIEASENPTSLLEGINKVAEVDIEILD